MKKFFSMNRIKLTCTIIAWLAILLMVRRYLYLPPYQHTANANNPQTHTTILTDKLPLVELPVQNTDSNILVIFVSGDGGWQELDTGVSQELNAAGISVVGIDSLRFFWRKRSAVETAAALTDIIDYYTKAWGKKQVFLVGYSQGADVLPSSISLIPEQTRAQISRVVLMGLSEDVLFEIKIGNWVEGGVYRLFKKRLGPTRTEALIDALGVKRAGIPMQPELEKIRGMKGLCIYGDKEGHEAHCRQQTVLTPVAMRGTHHFGSDYHALATLILTEKN